jgi:hypothetical protein
LVKKILQILKKILHHSSPLLSRDISLSPPSTIAYLKQLFDHSSPIFSGIQYCLFLHCLHKKKTTINRYLFYWHEKLLDRSTFFHGKRLETTGGSDGRVLRVMRAPRVTAQGRHRARLQGPLEPYLLAPVSFSPTHLTRGAIHPPWPSPRPTALATAPPSRCRPAAIPDSLLRPSPQTIPLPAAGATNHDRRCYIG